MNDITLYEDISEFENKFPIKVRRYKNCEFAPHWHEHIELHYILGGSGTFSCNSKSIGVRKSETVVVNSNELHYMTAPETVDYICVLIHPSLFSDVHCKNVIIQSKIPEDEFITNIFMRIYEEYLSNNKYSDIIIKGNICLLIAYLIKNFEGEELSQYEYNLRLSRMKNINMLLDFVHKNYTKQISTSALAQKLFISESHLCRIFKNAVGMSFIDYLNSFRVDKAAILLKNTDESISFIAQRVGFENLNYFDRIFKKYKKLSPNQYRKSIF